MDALTYVRSNLKKLGITDVNVKKLGRGGLGTYTVGSTKPYPKDQAEKISAGWKQKVDASGKFEGSENLSWGWGGKDDYYPLIHVWIDTDIVTKKSSKLEILSRNARPQMHTKASPYADPKGAEVLMDAKWGLLPRFVNTMNKLDSEGWPKFMSNYVEGVFDFLSTFSTANKIEFGKIRQAKENVRQLIVMFEKMTGDRLEGAELARAKVLKHSIVKLLQSIKKPSTV